MFEPKEHQFSVPFLGDGAAALNTARTTLLALGFDIEQDSDRELYAIGPGMHGNQQPTLLGVSKLLLQVENSSIQATAELGGAAKMKAFICLFPPALIATLLTGFTLLGMEMSWVHSLWLLPWLIISPILGNNLEGKTARAVDRLVKGMAQSDNNSGRRNGGSTAIHYRPLSS